jgi:TonB family protein
MLWGRFVLLDKLESGFLLLQTRQGLVAVEPSSFWQRVYLLWTFRNFRQLSLPLLNTRQTALINNLFRENAEAVSHRYDPWLVIGLVENFVPPPIEIDATLATQIDAALAMKANLPEEVAGLELAPPEVQIEAAPAAKIDVAPVAKEEEREESAAIASAEFAHESAHEGASARDRFLAPLAEWLESGASRVGTVAAEASRLVVSKLEASRIIASRLAASRITATELGMSRLAVSRIATAIGALGLCVCFVIAWHRIGAVPGSQAHNSPVQLSSPSSSPLPEPVRVAESSITLPAVTDQRIAGPEAAVEPASVKLASSVAAIAPTPKPRIRVHDAVSTPKLPLSIQDSAIQATRPPLRFVYPAYSGANARGVVTLTAGVDSKGNVRTVKIVSGSHALAAAAVRAVRQWRYRPYVKDGQPVATETNIVISFFSSEAISMSFPPRIPVSR